MLSLRDFFHPSELDALVERLVADGPGLTVVAGLDPRPAALPSGPQGFLPSGRSAIFRILMNQILTAQPAARAIVVAESKEAVHVPRQLRQRVRFLLVEPLQTYAIRLTEAIGRRPDLLVIDRLSPETATAALDAAQRGLRVLSQIDTVFRGADVARALLDLGVPHTLLGGLRWVVAVQRLPTLCPHCKEPVPPDPDRLAELRRRYPSLAPSPDGTFFQAAGCPECQFTGRQGDVAAFDIFYSAADSGDPFSQPSLLPLEAYVLRLADLGCLPLDDVLQLEKDQLQRTYNLLSASENALSQAKADLERKLAELEAANRVLQQRTAALVSLQEIGQALLTVIDLNDLAGRICRHTHKLCGADRAILYYLRKDKAEVLATSGWDPARVPQQLDAPAVFDARTDTTTEPVPFSRWPPGIVPRHPDLEGARLRAGLRVPLVAQDRPVGVMIVHATEKAAFTPGEVALLQTFAQQAALAVQRAELIEELLIKERLDHELALARQVQQSVLPRAFPQVPGYTFAACNEPASQVGGDFYDVIRLDTECFGLVIGDVSDKGMPAALYMALTRSLLLAEARRERSPGAVLRNVHRLLRELGEPDMFASVFYGVIDGPARQLTYARAGHDPPLLLRGGSAQHLGGEGTFLGFPGLDDLHLSEEQVVLAPGDRLVLYTDGLTDAMDSDGQPFGLGQLTSLLQAHAGLAPGELCPAVFTELRAYQGSAGQYDDMTMLVVDVEHS